MRPILDARFLRALSLDDQFRATLLDLTDRGVSRETVARALANAGVDVDAIGPDWIGAIRVARELKARYPAPPSTIPPSPDPRPRPGDSRRPRPRIRDRIDQVPSAALFMIGVAAGLVAIAAQYVIARVAVGVLIAGG